MKTMKLLLIHQNFPGQFRVLATALSKDSRFQLRAIGRDTAPGLPAAPNLRLDRYKPHRDIAQTTHPYLRRMEDAVLHGQATLRLLIQMRQEGFIPDVILAHPGWGETLYAKDAFPHARLIHFCEYYYHADGADANFDPEFPQTLDERVRIRTRNALHLLNLENCDAGVTPTRWQHSLHPAAYRDKIRLAHEGIDTENLGPDPEAVFDLPNGRKLRAGQPTLTYVARNLEPYRGFHRFMRALPKILDGHRECEVVIVGGDEVSYGSAPKGKANWREALLEEVAFTPEQRARMHFLGRIPYERYKKLLQVSAAHLYLTYPFVLSWSALEAMASGCLLIASRTPPVEEVVEDGVNGLLVDFFDVDAIAARVIEALSHPQTFTALRAEARRYACANYSLAAGLDAYKELIGA
jgi:glycosyltransferase involved in cell wall biosynthesis